MGAGSGAHGLGAGPHQCPWAGPGLALEPMGWGLAWLPAGLWGKWRAAVQGGSLWQCPPRPAPLHTRPRWALLPGEGTGCEPAPSFPCCSPATAPLTIRAPSASPCCCILGGSGAHTRLCTPVLSSLQLSAPWVPWGHFGVPLPHVCSPLGALFKARVLQLRKTPPANPLPRLGSQRLLCVSPLLPLLLCRAFLWGLLTMATGPLFRRGWSWSEELGGWRKEGQERKERRKVGRRGKGR